VKRFGRLAVWAALIVAAIARDAHACAMCGLPAGDIGTHAYNTSVLFMLVTPYTVCLIGAVVAFFAYRNGCRRRAAIERNDTEPQASGNR
jgi:hypothetical protein